MTIVQDVSLSSLNIEWFSSYDMIYWRDIEEILVSKNTNTFCYYLALGLSPN